MKIRELNVEGIPGTKGVLQYSWESGLNAWKQKGSFRLSYALDLLELLFFPSSGQDRPLGPGQCRKAKVIFEIRDHVFQIERDFEHRRVHLLQLEAGTQDQFREVSKDARTIMETLARSAKLPSRKLFRDLLISSFQVSLPSRLQSNETLGFEEEGKSLEVDPRKRLDELRREKISLREIADSEARLDSLHAEIYRIEGELQRLDEPKKQLEELDIELEPYAFLSGVQIDEKLRSRLIKFSSAESDRVRALKELEEKATELDDLLSAMPAKPAHMEPTLMIGTAVFLLMFIPEALLRNLLPLWLIIQAVGAGLAAYGFFRGTKRIANRIEIDEQRKKLDVEKSGINKRFEIETVPVRKLFEQLSTEDPEEIIENYDRRMEILQRREAVEIKLDEIKKEIGEEQLRFQKQSLEMEVKSLQEKLAEMPPVSMEPNQLEREIHLLEKKIASGQFVTAKTVLSDNDNDLNRIIAHLAEIVKMDFDSLLSRLKSPIEKNMAVMAQGRWKAISIQNNRISGFVSNQEETFSWEDLKEDDQRLLLFSIQFTAWQILSKEKGFPLFLDLTDPLISEDSRNVAMKGAKFLSTQTQILVLTI